MKVRIGGIKRISLVDVIGNIAFVVWFSYCNFKCPWCQNAPLRRGEGKDVEIDEIVKEFEEYSDFVDYFHVTGGEPTVQKEALIELNRKIKKIGKFSLNTNSSNPEVIKKLKLDHVATDLKSKPENYPKVVGVNVDFDKIIESYEYYKEKVPFVEIRTTFVPTLISEEDIFWIEKFIKEIFDGYNGRLVYVLQQFLPASTIEDERFRNLMPPSKEFLIALARKIDLPEVWVRTAGETIRIK